MNKGKTECFLHSCFIGKAFPGNVESSSMVYRHSQDVHGERKAHCPVEIIGFCSYVSLVMIKAEHCAVLSAKGLMENRIGSDWATHIQTGLPLITYSPFNYPFLCAELTSVSGMRIKCGNC